MDGAVKETRNSLRIRTQKRQQLGLRRTRSEDWPVSKQSSRGCEPTSSHKQPRTLSTHLISQRALQNSRADSRRNGGIQQSQVLIHHEKRLVVLPSQAPKQHRRNREAMSGAYAHVAPDDDVLFDASRPEAASGAPNLTFQGSSMHLAWLP